MKHGELTKEIIGCAMKVHSAMGPGFLESVYQNALAHELRKKAFRVEIERPIKVRYDDIVVGDFFADMLVNDLVLVEIKCVRFLGVAHEVRLVYFLTATVFENGLLLNFGYNLIEYTSL